LKGKILGNKIIFRGSTLNVQSSKEDIDLIYRETDIIFDQIRNEYECNIEHKISFTIVDKFGKPVPNVICSISVTGNATAPSSVTTNSDGRATIVISDSMNESITLTIRLMVVLKMTLLGGKRTEMGEQQLGLAL